MNNARTFSLARSPAGVNGVAQALREHGGILDRIYRISRIKKKSLKSPMASLEAQNELARFCPSKALHGPIDADRASRRALREPFE